MNCTDFQQRMQQLIDERVDLTVDEQLNGHAADCDSCCQQLHTWQEIESVFADVDADGSPQRSLVKATDGRLPSRLGMSLVSAAAAIVMMVFVASAFNRDDKSTRVAVTPPVAQPHDVPVDPTLWWQNVQPQDWIGQTMPAVQSVRKGVAPLGRSLIQAVAILTTSGGQQTS